MLLPLRVRGAGSVVACLHSGCRPRRPDGGRTICSRHAGRSVSAICSRLGHREPHLKGKSTVAAPHLRARCDPNQMGIPTLPPLLQACCNGDLRAVIDELARGADPNMREDAAVGGWAAVHYACWPGSNSDQKRADIVLALLGAGADPHARTATSNGAQTALSIAVRMGGGSRGVVARVLQHWTELEPQVSAQLAAVHPAMAQKCVLPFTCARVRDALHLNAQSSLFELLAAFNARRVGNRSSLARAPLANRQPRAAWALPLTRNKSAWCWSHKRAAPWSLAPRRRRPPRPTRRRCSRWPHCPR
jgi:hypothetical protein